MSIKNISSKNKIILKEGNITIIEEKRSKNDYYKEYTVSNSNNGDIPES